MRDKAWWHDEEKFRLDGVTEAGGKHDRKFRPEGDDSICLTGMILDTVEVARSTLSCHSGDAELTLFSWFSECNRIVEDLSPLYPTETSTDSYKRTLMVNRAGGDGIYRKPTPREVESHHSALRFLIGFGRVGHQNGWVGYEKTQHPIRHESTLCESQDRCFLTSSGGYMGIAPNGTKEGGATCILIRGDVPVILRQDGESFTLVGECYVHGVMEGEALEMKIPQQYILIK